MTAGSVTSPAMLELLVARERAPGETRVAATPETVRQLAALGAQVSVEAGAGAGAGIADESFAAAGARIATDARAAWQSADIVLGVRGPALGGEFDAVALLKPGALVVGLLAPFVELARVRALAEHNVDSLAMELVPRITRAQAMDALSSQANIAGYKAVLLAAAELPRYFPLLMTAAGTVKAARVVVLGAGVAGLSAIATARRLGAVVEASDVRPAVKEEVQSLGARFIEPPEGENAEGEGGYARAVSAEYLQRQQAVVAERVAAADVVVTTALVPGKPAPRLVTAETVRRMRPGSVIVDLGAEAGGNCELTERGKTVRRNGVVIIGHDNLPATVPADASTLYGRNVLALVRHVVQGGALALDPDDEVTGATLLTHAGRVVDERTAALLEAESAPPRREAPGQHAESR